MARTYSTPRMVGRVTTPIGVTYASLPSLGITGAPEVARRAESLGYSSFWVAETTGAEAFSHLALAGEAAPSLSLGTGVLALQLRTPMLTAMAGATLQAAHPENEVFIGVGISSPVVTTRWHGVPYTDRPLAQVREFVTVLRECLTGESVSHTGDFYELSRSRLGVRMGDRRPRIVIGALNEGMLRLAGELADGVLLNYLPATLVPWCIERVREGEARGGREPGSCTIHAYVHLGVVPREEGLDFAKRDLFSYAVVDAYAKSFEQAGYGDAVRAVREAHAAGERDAAVDAVSDAMVDGIDIMGDHAEIAAAMKAYVEAGVENPIVMALPWGKDRMGVVQATLEAAKDGV
jgi:probable F420-dependent oxidoreductase